MWPVSARWAPALTTSHNITTRVEVWRGANIIAVLPVNDGSITVTAKNRIRRTLSLVVPEAYFPAEPDDILAPYGNEIRVYRGIDYGASTETVPVFRGLIKTIDSRKRYDGQLAVTADDLMSTVNDARFEAPRAAPAINTTGGIAQLITEAAPADTHVTVAANVIDAVIPGGLLWDRDRGQAVDDLAVSIGAEAWFDPSGAPHITAPALLTDPAVWTLTDGVGGTVVSDARSVSRDGVYSVVVVVVERADGTPPIQISVADTDPTSPTYAGGPFGRIPRFYKSALVASVDQAITAGQALLAKSTGLTRTRSIECVPNPALEAGDRVNITVAGVTEHHIVDSFTLPFGPTGLMQITTRSAKPDPGDVGG